jgi:hypothetical protein
MVITIVPATAKNRSITKTPPCVNEGIGEEARVQGAGCRGQGAGGNNFPDHQLPITNYQSPITNYPFPVVLLYSYQRMMKKEKARSSVNTAHIRGEASSQDFLTS